MILKINPNIQKFIDKYQKLLIADKEVCCPYFINNKITSGNLRVMAGKGDPDEIVLETKVWAKVKGFDLESASEEDIRKFMIGQHIGIDCSGFISNVLDLYYRESGKGGLIKYLKFSDNSFFMKLRRLLRPIENIGANTLTSDLNCEKINNLNDIQPGDFIRAKGRQKNAHHIGMITEVEKEKGTIKRFVYVNSTRFYGQDNGIRYGEVVILDPDGELKDQNWLDIHTDGRNYFYEDLMVEYEDNGIRRFRLALDFCVC